MKNLLQIENLSVSIKNKPVINRLNLAIKQGEVHALMGPNGSGKSSLALFLAGHPDYQEDEGSVLIKNKNLLNQTPDKRSLSDFFVSYQNPVSIPGVSVSTILRTSINAHLKANQKPPIEVADFYKIIRPIFAQLKIDQKMLARDFNDGFSGGERKKIEMAFYLLLKPNLGIFDEIDSGLDVDSIKTLAKCIKDSVNSDRSVLLITHYNRLLKYIKPDFVHIFKDGQIKKSGNYQLALEIEKKGYEKL